jgi:hypothetical protein
VPDDNALIERARKLLDSLFGPVVHTDASTARVLEALAAERKLAYDKALDNAAWTLRQWGFTLKSNEQAAIVSECADRVRALLSEEPKP